MTLLNLRGLAKSYPASSPGGHIHHAVTAIELTVAQGEFRCLLGPSGCGKSTLLNIVAGFEKASDGESLLEGKAILGPGSDRVVVFQDSSASLFPWLSARENVEFGPQLRGDSPKHCRDLSERYLELVGLSADRDKFPSQLSGGMRQRVQIARALAMNPKMLLMDEPFGALDSHTRRRMHAELLRIWQSTGTTILFVTHDVGEAISLADTITVLSMGPGSTVRAEVNVDLPRPRDPNSVEFFRLSAHVDTLIQHGGDEL